MTGTTDAKREAPPPTDFTRYLADRLGLSPDAAEARLEYLLEHYVPLRRCGPQHGAVRQREREATPLGRAS